jgi:S1-C subfamily serine protease
MQVPRSGSMRGGLRVYLGTVPDYARTDVLGVALSGVAQGGPADKASVRAGDVIVQLAGQSVENIYDYTYALEGLAVGEPVEIHVVREGERVVLEITPESRQ